MHRPWTVRVDNVLIAGHTRTEPTTPSESQPPNINRLTREITSTNATHACTQKRKGNGLGLRAQWTVLAQLSTKAEYGRTERAPFGKAVAPYSRPYRATEVDGARRSRLKSTDKVSSANSRR